MPNLDLFDLKQRKKRPPSLPENPEQDKKGRFPSWLHRKLPKGGALRGTGKILKENSLPTVCEEAKCPNRLECFSKQTATFLALGKECTRSCGFCDILFNASPAALDPKEPQSISNSVKQLGLKHVVITMVARDDLPDGGALQMTRIVEQVRKDAPDCTIELLTSDFQGNQDAWKTLLSCKPEIFNYNLETVRSLTPRVRHKATYERTLEFLRFAKQSQQCRFVKSGLMVGLGEEEKEVKASLNDLKQAGCDIVTIGQYLQPSKKKLRVKAFIPPHLFENYEQYGHTIGIPFVYSGPFVRSSYNADYVQRKVNAK